MLRAVLSRILGTFHRRRLDEEFDDEVRSHLEMLEERFIARGMKPAEALYAARRQFGGVTQVKQDLRERRALPAIDLLVQDVRHAFRQLGKARGFTALAALTLALGIGAGTAVFAVLDSVVLQPLPFDEPGRLMAFRSLDSRGTPRPTLLSYPDFFDFRKQNQVFEHLVSYRDSGFTLTDSLPAIQVMGEIVSWDLFPMLGVQPELGRGFLREDENPGTHAVVLSHDMWQSRFAGDEGILGRAIPMNGMLFTVVGVAPAGFQFPADVSAVKLWVTLSEDATVSDQRGARMLDAIGRLKPGVSAEQAQTQMDLVARALAQQYPGNKNVAGTLVMPELERMAGSNLKPLLILLGAVAMLLLIACANVANMLLARNTGRAREFALRTALGASRAAIVRQMLIESLALGFLGAAGGILLALGALKALLPLVGESIPRLSQASIDGRVLAFSIVMAVLTSVLFSLAPAFQAAGANPAGALKAGARSIARGNDRFRGALVVVQITLGLVLLVGAELLMASFLQLVQRDPGFRTDHLLTFDIGLPEAQYNGARQAAFCDRLLEHLRAIPGVEAVATGRPLPLQGHQMRIAFDIEERPVAAPDRPRSDTAIVTPGYFGALGIPLLKGRDFNERDDPEAPPVLVVNQAFVRKFFPGKDVIGKRIQPGAGREPIMREIVGVVGDARQAAIGVDSDPIYYFPYKQLPWGIGTIVLRTAVPPLEIESAARAALASLDRQVPMHVVRTGEDLSRRTVARMQFLIMLMGSFAAAALLLTGAGLYGVLSYAVARRRGEIGVRIALGAGRKEVLALVFRQAMQLVTVGLILGLASAVAAGRLLETMMHGIRTEDPAALVGACCVLLITSMAAASIPAARAASVDPIQALRSE
jgi:putative ABC transport system permease protein